jgi:dTMP kinase
MTIEVGQHAIPTVVTGRVVSLRGRLLTVEGLDGAGKTTLVSGLTAAFDDRGVPVLVLREPGGVELSERVRALVQDPEIRCDARTEALLYAAARAQLVGEVLEPALGSGTWVLLDRFVDSSLAYQGGGRGLGVEAVAELNRFGTGGLVPDRTLLLRVAPEIGRARLAGRGGAPDRLEAEDEAFFARVAAAYDALAAAEPGRFRVLDGALAPEDVLAAALRGLGDLLPAAET